MKSLINYGVISFSIFSKCASFYFQLSLNCAFSFNSHLQGISFDFGAVTIDPQTPSYDPSPLKEYLSSLDVPYFYESQCRQIVYSYFKGFTECRFQHL